MKTYSWKYLWTCFIHDNTKKGEIWKKCKKLKKGVDEIKRRWYTKSRFKRSEIFFFSIRKIWKKKIKKLLTSIWKYDKVLKSFEWMTKNFRKILKISKNFWKKFLTRFERYDKVNKLLQIADSKTTLITKQWNTYDSRKFLYTIHFRMKTY